MLGTHGCIVPSPSIPILFQGLTAAMKTLTEAERAEIGSLARKPHNVSALARKYGVSRETVCRWLDEGRKKGPNYADAPRPGRAPALKAHDRANIKRSGRRGLTAVAITANLNKHRGSPISHHTVARALAAGPHPMQWGAIKRGKVLRAPNKLRRIKFCQSNQRCHHSKWVFMDAKFLFVYRSEKGYVHFCWQDKSSKQKVEPNSNPWVFLFYAVVAKGHKSKLFFVPPSPAPGSKAHKNKESFKSEHFVKVLQELVPEVDGWFGGRGRWSLVMDHASQHTSKETDLVLQQLGVKMVEGFPAQRWDINVIENCWGLLDTKLLGHKAKSTDGWYSAIQKAWDEIDQGTIDHLVTTVKHRMQQVVELEGEWIKPPKGSQRD